MPIVRDEQGNLRVQSGAVSLPWTLGPERAAALGFDAPPMPGLTDPSRMAVAGPGGGPDPRMGSSDFDVPMGAPAAPQAAAPPVALPRASAKERAAHEKELAATSARLQTEAKGRAEAAQAAVPASKGSAESRYAGGDKPSYLGNFDPAAPKKSGKGVGRFGAEESHDLPDGPGEPIGERLTAARGGGARLIPGGMQLAGYSRQVGADKGDLANMNESGAKAAEAEAESVQRQAMGDTIRNASQAQLLGQQIDHKQALVGNAEQRIAQARQEYDATQADIDNERGKVDSLDKDPYRYYAGSGSVAKIIGTIAAAIGGGIQSGLNHSGKNPYLDAIRQTISEDNAEHQRRKDVRRGAINLRQKQLDSRMAHFDPDTAAREMEADKLSLAAAMDQKFALQTKNPEIIAASQARVAQLYAQRDAIRAENNMKLGDQITEKHMMTPDRVIGGAPAVNENDVQALARDREKAGIGEAEGQAGAVNDLISALPDGELPTAESRNIVSRGARGLVDLVAGAGSSAKSFDSKAEQAATAQLERAKAALLHKLSGAAISPSEMERLSRGLNELNSKDGLRRYNTELDRTIERRDAGVKAGYKPEVVETFESRQRSRQPAQRGNRTAR